MYNKRQFKKLNDKKELHKIGKRWATVSVALLSLLGGSAVVTHADTNTDQVNNDQNQMNHQVNIGQLQNNRDALQTNGQSNYNSQYGQSSQAPVHKNMIAAQATRIQDHVIRDANLNNHSANDTATFQASNVASKGGTNSMISDSTGSIGQNYLNLNGSYSSYSADDSFADSLSRSMASNINNLNDPHFATQSFDFPTTGVDRDVTPASNRYQDADQSLNSVVNDTTTSGSTGLDQSAPSGSMMIANSLASLSSEIKTKYGSMASRMADNYINKVLSYHNNAVSDDSYAMNSLDNLRPANSDLGSLYARDMGEVVSNRNFIDSQDASMVSGLKAMNAQRQASTFDLGSVISSAGNDIAVASVNDQNAESILNHDVSTLVSMNNLVSSEDSNAASASASISNSISVSNSASLSASVSTSTSASLNNSVRANTHASTSGLIRNDLNEINSYDKAAQHNDSLALSDLNRINVSSNASLSDLKRNDINEAYDDDSIVGEDVSLVNSFANDLRNGSYQPNLAISSANRQVTAASDVAEDASLIIRDDVATLESASGQVNSNGIHPASTSSTSNNSSNNVITSYAENAIKMDRMNFNMYAGQISQAVTNRNVRSNVVASLQVSNDDRVASKAYRMIMNDQGHPDLANVNNANEELSSIASAGQNAQRVASSVMNSAASASAGVLNHRGHPSRSATSSNPSKSRRVSNVVNPQHSTSSSYNSFSGRDSPSTASQSVASPSSNETSQSAPSSTSSYEDSSESDDDTSDDANENSATSSNSDNQMANRIDANSGSTVNKTQQQATQTNVNNSNSGNLPKTGESESSQSKAVAAALLAVSINIGALNVLVDRKRRYD